MIDVKKKIAELIKENINVEEDVTQALFDIGLLEEHVCKKVLIRNEYYTKCSYRHKTELKIMIAEKFCVSLSTVEKYIAV